VNVIEHFLQALEHEAAILVTVHSTRGSAPREAGAWMAVLANEVIGTVGGGHLELDAIHHAQSLLVQPFSIPLPEPVRYVLGPSLGQCCGGEVYLQFARVSASDREAVAQRLQPPLRPVALFGGGHVGRALVHVLATLPFAVRWVDSRDEIFPPAVPANVVCEHSDPVQAVVAELPSGTSVLIMSFSHAEDLDIVAACLQRQRTQGDLPYIGLIGSATKWAVFGKRLQARGYSPHELTHVTCPIGVTGIRDKRPEVIAVAVAAQLLQASEK
jgi:xanthine dehydrogenase accessory factor